MILDKDTLERILHEQMRVLLFEKKYEEVNLKRENKEAETVRFFAHFALFLDLLSKWRPVEIPDSHIPALVVTPFSVVSAKDQVERLEYCGKKAWAFTMKEEWIRNLENGIPDDPYLLIDVQHGKERLNHATEVSELLIKEQGRHALTVNEGVAFATQVPEVFTDSYIMELAGSRYGQRVVPKFARAGHHDAWPPSEPIDVPITETQLEPGIDRPMLMLESGAPRLCARLPEEGGRAMSFFDENWGVSSCAERIDPRKY